MALPVTLCPRCVPSAEQWDKDHTPLTFEDVEGVGFCRRCGVAVLARLNTEAAAHEVTP